MKRIKSISLLLLLAAGTCNTQKASAIPASIYRVLIFPALYFLYGTCKQDKQQKALNTPSTDMEVKFYTYNENSETCSGILDLFSTPLQNVPMPGEQAAQTATPVAKNNPQKIFALHNKVYSVRPKNFPSNDSTFTYELLHHYGMISHGYTTSIKDQFLIPLALYAVPAIGMESIIRFVKNKKLFTSPLPIVGLWGGFLCTQVLIQQAMKRWQHYHADEFAFGHMISQKIGGIQVERCLNAMQHKICTQKPSIAQRIANLFQSQRLLYDRYQRATKHWKNAGVTWAPVTT
ncbi:MAG: hypothetical protein UU47_C0005G0001 [candidate division TM6 bacterium GW2011_GWE2_41_16]|nr:MAG: hypothetical protein UU47_C0005G0001 [candidate division TM6 bacterium GW2011_GWE2_41_16]